MPSGKSHPEAPHDGPLSSEAFEVLQDRVEHEELEARVEIWHLHEMVELFGA